MDIEERIPQNHPLRLISRIVNEALGALDGEFAKLYAENGHAENGRPSTAPERLRRRLLGAFCTIRSEPQLMEQLHYSLRTCSALGLCASAEPPTLQINPERVA